MRLCINMLIFTHNLGNWLIGCMCMGDACCRRWWCRASCQWSSTDTQTAQSSLMFYCCYNSQTEVCLVRVWWSHRQNTHWRKVPVEAEKF